MNNSILQTNDTYSCQGSVQEVGDVVFTVNATDADSGLGGAIQFELVGTNPLFSISSSGVVIISGKLDHEEHRLRPVTPAYFILCISLSLSLSLSRC